MFSLAINHIIPETVFYSLKDYPSYPKTPLIEELTGKIGKEKSIPTKWKGFKIRLDQRFLILAAH